MGLKCAVYYNALGMENESEFSARLYFYVGLVQGA